MVGILILSLMMPDASAVNAQIDWVGSIKAVLKILEDNRTDCRELARSLRPHTKTVQPPNAEDLTDLEEQQIYVNAKRLGDMLSDHQGLIDDIKTRCAQPEIQKVVELIERAAAFLQVYANEGLIRPPVFIFPHRGVELPPSTSLLRPVASVRVEISSKAISVNGVQALELKDGQITELDRQKFPGAPLPVAPLLKRILEQEEQDKQAAAQNQGKQQLERSAEVVICDPPPCGVSKLLTLVADRRISFGTLTRVLTTAAHAGYGHYKFAVARGRDTVRVININIPPEAAEPSSPGASHAVRDLNLLVDITYQGFLIAGAEKALQETERSIPLLSRVPGCNSSPSGPPPVTCYDTALLTKLLAKVKNAFPDETLVTLSAQPGVSYDTVVRVLDASRQEGDRALFYDVILSTGID